MVLPFCVNQRLIAFVRGGKSFAKRLEITNIRKSDITFWHNNTKMDQQWNITKTTRYMHTCNSGEMTSKINCILVDVFQKQY